MRGSCCGLMQGMGPRARAAYTPDRTLCVQAEGPAREAAAAPGACADPGRLLLHTLPAAGHWCADDCPWPACLQG
jgi:hypothetical protein